MVTELRRTSIARLSTDGDNKGVRVVAVRYFLDRPGADLTKASVRIYQNPPAACKASDVKAYLERQNLVPAVAGERHPDADPDVFFKLIFGAFETSVKTCEWIAMVLTWILSIIASVTVWKSTTACVGDDAAHRAGVASMAWRSTRRFKAS